MTACLTIEEVAQESTERLPAPPILGTMSVPCP
jgi:hypothetical protein